MSSGVSILSITHSESGGRGGTASDVRTAASMDVGAATVVTAVTWMARTGPSICKLSPRVIVGQIDSAAPGVGACCVGTLPSAEVVRAVMRRLQRRRVPRIVLCPSIFKGDGTRLLSASGAGRLSSFLPGCACVVAREADAWGLITGAADEPDSGASNAARRLVDRGASAAVVFPDGPSTTASVYDGTVCGELSIDAPPADACFLLAGALACRLARGDTLPLALETAAEWLNRGRGKSG